MVSLLDQNSTSSSRGVQGPWRGGRRPQQGILTDWSIAYYLWGKAWSTAVGESTASNCSEVARVDRRPFDVGAGRLAIHVAHRERASRITRAQASDGLD